MSKNVTKKKYKVKVLKEIKNKKKPSILFICDVIGWAWWIKAHYLKQYLSDEFDIDIISVIGEGSSRSIRNDYDIYFTFGFDFVDLIRWIPQGKKITCVTAHRNWEQFKVAEKSKFVDAVVAVSNLLLEEIKEFHPNTYYLPNGVDETLFREIIPIPLERDNLYVGHVGKLFPVKNQKSIIEPACKLAEVVYLPHYNNHKNAIPHSHMVNIYQNMDLFICASDEDGTPNGGLEAASCGRAIISNNIGNLPDLLSAGNCGIIVEKNIDAYVEALLYLKNNRNKLVEMGKNARKEIETNWTWKIQAENYRKMFREVLG